MHSFNPVRFVLAGFSFRFVVDVLFDSIRVTRGKRIGLYDPENLRNFQNVKKLLKILGDFATI